MEYKIKNRVTPGIVYSCYHRKSKGGEHFVSEHVLTYQISGTLTLSDGTKEYEHTSGALKLLTRNQLLRFTKTPPEYGEFKSLSIYLDQAAVKRFSLEEDLKFVHKPHDASVIELQPGIVLKSFFESLLIYNDNGSFENQQFIALKQKEVLMLIFQVHPELKQILFDFDDPYKIDLKAFMNQNYHFNVHLEQFAYLTGRSLASFKRDFSKIFGTTPGKWLKHKRLDEAFFLISERGKSASDVYLDLGFEDLSHFSFAFKKQFGVAPSKIVNL